MRLKLERYAMRCPECGEQLDSKAVFCPHCGAQLDDADNSSKQAQRSAQSRSSLPTRAEGGTRVGASERASSSGGTHAARKQTRRSRHKFIAAVLGVAVLLVATYLIWDVNFRPYNINAKDFPSAGLRAAAETVDTDHDGSISRDEAAAVESLTITSGDKIYGFDVFPNLKALVLDSDEITSVDVSSASHLQTLTGVKVASLSEVVLKGNESLTTIDLANTKLTSLDVRQAPHLKTVVLAGAPLQKIDVSALRDLVVLDVSDTDLERIDVKGLSSLACLSCESDVTVENLSDTSMQPYWVVVDYQNNVPEFGPLPRQRVQIQASYDANNRLQAVEYRDMDALTLKPAQAAYAYDDAGNLVQASFTGLRDDDGKVLDCTWELSYDNSGRLTSASNDAGTQCTYEYDSSGRLKTYSTDDSTGAVQRYSFTYDKAGHISAITLNGTEQTLYSYNAAGQVTDATVVSASAAAAAAATASSSESASDADAQEDGKTAHVLGLDDAEGLAGDLGSPGQQERSTATGEDGGTAANSANSGEGTQGAQSSEMASSATETDASYAYTYDESGACTRCDFSAGKSSSVGSYVEVYTYASDGSLLDAQRTAKAGSTGSNYLYHDVTSAQYGYASDGSLVSVALTRANQSDGAHETYALRYRCVYASEAYAPSGLIWQSGYPLESLYDGGANLATAVLSGQSQLTPWARIPRVQDMVFNPQTALFGNPLP